MNNGETLDALYCYILIDPPLLGGLMWKNVCLSVCVTPLYLKNWTFLDFHTWRVYTPPKWQEQALTNIFSTVLEASK